MNRIAISKMPNHSNKLAYMMLDDNRNLIDFEIIDSPSDSDGKGSLLNNIYIGRVDNIVRNINSAFIKIADGQNCYLSLDNARNPFFVKQQSVSKGLCIGDEILVQVIKDAVKTKDPVVSCNLSIHGKHCMLTSGNKSFGLSKKINALKAAEITEKLKQELNNDNYGYLIRTSAGQVELSDLEEDIADSRKIFDDILEKSSHLSYPSKIYSAEAGYVLKLKSEKTDNFDCVITDVEEVFKELSSYFTSDIYRDKIKLYSDERVSLSTLYNLGGQIEKLISNKVWLKSGANIIIEQLETLTVIDVNTGKNMSKADNYIAEVNCEAAIEIARQLRLRNISGMIIIDFINMKEDKEQEMLINCLKREIAKDPVKCSFIDITKLGLVELTRKKVRKSLKELI